MVKKKKRGRPKTDSAIRDKRVVIYLTEKDSEFLAELAGDLEFKGRSEFIATVMERLILGGFSPMIGLKLGFQLQKRAKQVGAGKGKGFYFGIKPLPDFPDRPKIPLPDDEMTGEDLEDSRDSLMDLKTEAS